MWPWSYLGLTCLLAFFKKWSLPGNFFVLLFLLPTASSISSDASEVEDSSVELQELNSDKTSWISLILDITDLLGFRKESWLPRSSLARDPLGGVLLLRDMLCLLTTKSLGTSDQSGIWDSQFLATEPVPGDVASSGPVQDRVGLGLGWGELSCCKMFSSGRGFTVQGLLSRETGPELRFGVFPCWVSGGRGIPGSRHGTASAFSGVRGMIPLQNTFL